MSSQQCDSLWELQDPEFDFRQFRSNNSSKTSSNCFPHLSHPSL